MNDQDPHREITLMKPLRKSTWVLLILGASAGCAGDTDSPAPAPSLSPPAYSKQTPTAVNGKSDMPRAAAGAGEMTSPATKTADGAKGDEAPKIEGPKLETAKPEAGAVKLTADEQAAIKELPASEQAAATAQAVCPVSNENLGSMGKPLKVTAEGRTFYLCCKNCEKDLKADPKAIIAKLDKLGTGK
jgi:hypothetical protein